MYRVNGAGTPRSVLLYSVRQPYPILDRFLLADLGVYDLETNKLIFIDQLYGGGRYSEPNPILYWGTTKADKPDRYWVLNLAAVPPAQ
ncbi:hypothetical protein [Nonomuraea cavernae]|uniref:Uncharacterized protein n=1 Tax=Nonomuraea cavernae TaxID=2045107 RepID=A0A917ZB22_9ACTN|nr:hypothetical protein [Nonomuraea cavernae]MCA2189933.1 hypothetical protein [Nonomuraea cavernae]GGO77928.1 hypothetical protein GCM10012289_58740 [Nonomuraea cavernae]